ncbi:MAG: hypothetical protein PUF03_01300 [Lachnospiraceae bacterium]|nr:hypothetical protein [Lachnospiraceae bacterium]
MSDSMETGGFGKNPAIEKINQVNAVSERIDAVSELESKIFSSKQPRAQAVLRRRNQIMEEFHISFRKKEIEDNESVLYTRERGLLSGEYRFSTCETGQAESVPGVAGGILSDGGRKTVQDVSMGGKTGGYMGKQLWCADNRADDGTEDKNRGGLQRSSGIAGINRINISEVQNFPGSLE